MIISAFFALSTANYENISKHLIFFLLIFLSFLIFLIFYNFFELVDWEMYRKEKSPFVPVISWISLYAHSDRGRNFRVRTCRTFRSFFSSIALRIIEEKRRENKKKKKRREEKRREEAFGIEI